MDKSKPAKNNFFWISSLLILAVLFYADKFVLAANQSPPTLQEQIKKAFLWGIGIISVLAAANFAMGATQYIYSSANPAIKKDAKERMLGSLLGLVLLLASVIIMDTVNPQIAKLEVKGLNKTTGIFYFNGNQKEDKPAPMEEADSTYAQGIGYHQLKYTCLGGTGTPIVIWFYPDKYFQDQDSFYSNTTTKIVPCGDYTDIQGKSFRISFLNPGVYFFLKSGCQGYMSESLITSQGPISVPFQGNVKSMWIVNGIDMVTSTFTGKKFDLGTKYGIIFHNNLNLNSVAQCSRIIIDEDNSNQDPMQNCTDISINAQSANIFSYNIGDNANSMTTTVISKDVIGIYSKPWGWKTSQLFGGVGGARAGYYDDGVSYNDRNNQLFPHMSINPDSLEFKYSGDELPQYQKLCESFNSNIPLCQGSIKIPKETFLALYTAKPDTGYAYCQTFYSNINSLKETEFLATGNKIGSIEIISTSLFKNFFKANDLIE